MMVDNPVTSSAVDSVSMPVSSLLTTSGTGDSRSPSTSKRIRSAQAFIGRLMLLASFRATMMESRMASTIITRLMAISKYVVDR